MAPAHGANLEMGGVERKGDKGMEFPGKRALIISAAVLCIVCLRALEMESSATEAGVDIDFIMAAGDYNLSRIADGQGLIQMVQEITVPGIDEQGGEVSQVTVSFIMSNGDIDKVRCDSFTTKENNEYLTSCYSDTQSVTRYIADRNVAYIRPVVDRNAMWFPNPERWANPLYYGASIVGISIRKAIEDLTSRGATWELKQGSAENLVLLEVNISDDDGNRGKTLYQIDIDKNCFISSIESFLLPRGQGEWVVSASVDITSVLTNVGWVSQEVNSLVHSFEKGEDGSVDLRWIVKEKTTYSDLAFNVGLDGASLELSLPPETLINDEIARVVYRIP